MPTPSQIRNMVNTFRQDTSFLKLKQRWNTDYDLWRLKPYDAGKGFVSYTTNEPRVLADKVLALLGNAVLNIRIDSDTLDQEGRRIASNIERLLYGILYMNDARLLRIPGIESLRAQMAWHTVIRGGYALFPLVYKNKKDGKTLSDITIWDLYNTAYELGVDGVKSAAYSYRAGRNFIENRFGEDTLSSGVREEDVIEYVDGELIQVIIGDKVVKESKHGLGYCPVFILLAESSPQVGSDTYQYTGIHCGESIFASNRVIYPAISKTMSDRLTLVRRGVKVPIGYWSAGGQKTLDDDIWQTDKAASISLDSGSNEKIAPIFEQSMPSDTEPLLAWMSGEIQRGGMSHVAQGELGFRLSGYAINQLTDSVLQVLKPFASCLERGYSLIATEVLTQFAKGKFAPIEVRGRTAQGQDFGMQDPLAIKSDDIRGTWRPQVTLEPTLPQNDLEKMQLAQMARQGEIPLLSAETCREMIGVRDTDLEADKVAGDYENSILMVKLYKALKRASADGREDDAMNITMELQRILGMLGMPQGQGGQQAQGGRPVGNPSSQVQPAEARTPVPPGAANASPLTEIPENGGE